MTAKRARIGLAAALNLASSPTKAPKPSVSESAEKPWPVVFAAASSSLPTVHVNGVGDFLQNCHYCKKRIAMKENIFMYGTLQGFCSIECRDMQMALDELAEKSARTMTPCHE